MADNPTPSAKNKQLSIEEYAKIKEKMAKSKLKLSFPWIIKLCFIVPLIYFIVLLLLYIFNVRHIAEH